MNHKRKQIALLGLGLCLLVLSSACFKKNEKKAIHLRNVEVVATTGMIADTVSEIGKGRVQVKGLMGPGVDPHLYKASESDVAALGHADIIFYNGLHLESKMAAVLEKMKRSKPVYAVTDAIPKEALISPPDFEGLYDPHVWFDVMLWRSTVDTIVTALSELDPRSAALYQKNGQAYQERLDRLDRYVRDLSHTIPKQQRILITAHDAFHYFAKAYGFQVKGLQGISTNAEAGIKDVQALADFIYNRRIPAIFVESSVSKRNLQAVQAAVKAKGWQTGIGGELFSDAMGDAGTKEGSYIGMVEHNINTIAAALLGKYSQEIKENE